MLDIKALLRIAIERKASDLHLKTGARPHVRVSGDLQPVESFDEVTKEQSQDLVQHLLNTRQREMLSRKSEVDLSFGIAGLGRFRVAVFHQRSSLSLVFRLISDGVPSFEELRLPEVLKQIAEEKRGLILVTGATGSGKSTTLASMIQYINETRPAHIVTIEDPIEYLLPDKSSIVTQREINVDTDGFASALRAALRQDPDVIMVGEMRDLETVQTALQAAETGHLVLSTLHTGDAAETVNRIISIFPPFQQNEVRHQFASVLKAIISMRLIQSSVVQGRVPAVEILRNTELVKSLIEQPERQKELRKALETGRTHYGMQTFDQSIFDHYQNGSISMKDALANASNPEDLRLRIEGIVSSSESL